MEWCDPQSQAGACFATSPARCRRSSRAGIGHGGSGAGKTVELTDFVGELRDSVLTGKVSGRKLAGENAPLFVLDGRTLQLLKTKASTAVLEGTTVEQAKQLNDTLRTDALAGGLVLALAQINRQHRLSRSADPR
jgi:hypothetical protein